MVELVADAVASTLRERGFKRRSTTWNRRIGDFTDVIDLQLSKSLDRVWVIGYAVIRAKLGDMSGACELLENLIANGPGEWLPRIQSVHRQLGCRQGGP